MSSNQSINLVILLILVGIFVIRSKEKKLTLLFLFIMLVVYWAYCWIGSLLYTDVPVAFYFTKNGVSMSFIGAILLVTTSIFIMVGIVKLFGLEKK